MQESKGEAQPYIDEVGVAQWLVGDRSAAVETFATAVAGILHGPVAYADAAGGVSHGLLLWYAGVTTHDGRAVALALQFLGDLAAKSRIDVWPGPIARFALSQTGSEEIVRSSNIEFLNPPPTKEQRDLSLRRDLAKTLFYRGVKRRAAGDESGCRGAMAECAAVRNPVVEVEWYLARAEVRA